VDTLFFRANSWYVAACLALFMSAGWLLAVSHGKRMRARGRTSSESEFDTASLALLGLLLAFTFSLAAAKHDERRRMVVVDANAIGDLYTCASLLNDPVRTQLQDVVRDYVRLRLEAASRPLDDARLAVYLKQCQQKLDRMTALVQEALAAGTSIAVPLTNSLNEVSSNQALRVSALEDRLPGSIVLLLVAAAVVTAVLSGREEGLADRPDTGGMVAFVLMVAVTVFVTLDLNQPQRGLIRVSQAPMERLLDSMSR